MGEPRLELLDDWDPRTVLTTLEMEDDGNCFTLEQKNQDKKVTFFVRPFQTLFASLLCFINLMFALLYFYRYVVD